MFLIFFTKKEEILVVRIKAAYPEDTIFITLGISTADIKGRQLFAFTRLVANHKFSYFFLRNTFISFFIDFDIFGFFIPNFSNFFSARIALPTAPDFLTQRLVSGL